MSATCTAPSLGHVAGSQHERDCPVHGGRRRSVSPLASATPTGAAEQRERERPELDSMMEFGSAYFVTSDGSVEHAAGHYAPSFVDDEVDDPDWEAVSGFTGQYGYNGPVMHQSEYLGGSMEKHVWDNPGIYAIVEATVTTDEDGEDSGMDGMDDPPVGWVLLHKKD